MRDIGLMILLFVGGVLAGGLVVSRQQANLHVWSLIGIMLTGGLLGGVVNHLLAKADEPADTPSKASLLRSVLAGIAAALLVPLFLNMLSSDLLKAEEWKPLSALVFLGFCLVAAISSKAFITTISDKLISEVKQANENAAEAKKDAASAQQKANAAVEGQAEPPPEAPGGVLAEELAVAPPNTAETRVLRAFLTRPNFKFRYLYGVTNDSQIDPDEVKKSLANLEAGGLVAETEDKENRKLYYLTSEGKAAVERLGLD